MNYRCEKCKKMINPKDIGLLTRQMGNGIDQIYFICPHCKKEFHIAYRDEECRRLLKALNETTDIIEATILQAQFKLAMDKINKKVI